MQKDPIVKEVSYHHQFIFVKFQTNIIERWYYDPPLRNVKFKIPKDPFIGGKVNICRQYLFGDDKYIMLPFRSWSKGNFIEQRLSIHRYLYKIKDWMQIEYSQEELIQDFQKIIDTKLNKAHLIKNRIFPYGNYSGNKPPGQKLIDHFNHEHYRWTFFSLYNIIRRLLNFRCDITRHNLTWLIKRNYLPVCFYRSILKFLGAKQWNILDPYPNISKAIACTVEDCNYNSPINYPELGNFLGTEFNKDSNYDMVLLDKNFSSVFNLEEWRGKADILVVFVNKKDINSYPKPDKQLSVLDMAGKGFNYIYYYL